MRGVWVHKSGGEQTGKEKRTEQGKGEKEKKRHVMKPHLFTQEIVILSMHLLNTFGNWPLYKRQ